MHGSNTEGDELTSDKSNQIRSKVNH